MGARRGGRVPGFPDTRHDHGRCRQQALAGAQAVCARAGARFTPLRRDVFEIIWRSHQPVGAYQILQALTAAGRRGAPPTVYRALEFLLELGLVHRIESLNAFVGCSRPGHRAGVQFLICQACGCALEISDPDVDAAIGCRLSALGFQAYQATVEISGVCARCGDGGGAAT